MKKYVAIALLAMVLGFSLVSAQTGTPSITRSAPADGSVYPVNPLYRWGGLRAVTLYMTTLQGVRNANDFLVKTSAGEIIPIQTMQLIGFFSNAVVLTFDPPLPVGQRTRIT